MGDGGDFRSALYGNNPGYSSHSGRNRGEVYHLFGNANEKNNSCIGMSVYLRKKETAVQSGGRVWTGPGPWEAVRVGGGGAARYVQGVGSPRPPHPNLIV